MKKLTKDKGFTLIELLAVILILGIIALIAIPTVNNIINESKKGAFKSTVQNIITAVEQQCQLEQVKGVEHTSYYNFLNSNVTPNLEIKGTLPTEGIIYVDEECNIELNVSNDSYTVSKDKDNDSIIIAEKPTYASVGQLVDNLLSESHTYTYMGGTYLKGIQDSNYLWYSNNLYRIMGKDENGNIRLITEGSVVDITYGTQTDNSNVFSNSYAKEWLNDYFYNKLDNPSILQNTSYCLDATDDAQSARETCTSSIKDTKITTISLDEYMLSQEPRTYSCNDIGLKLLQFWQEATLSDFQSYLANENISCSNYVEEMLIYYESAGVKFMYDDANNEFSLNYSYLDSKNHDFFGTLTLNLSDPSFSWFVDTHPSFAVSAAITAPNPIRPIITIPYDISIMGGNGTQIQPILIEKIEETSGRLIDYVTSGEYVNVEGHRYRVIEKISDVGTKLVLDGYLDVEDTYTDMITKMRNNAYLSNLGLTTTDSRLVNFSWDYGNYYDYGNNYTASLAATTNTFTSYIGGIRIGEMYATRSVSIPLTSRRWYWSITKASSSEAWLIGAPGYTMHFSFNYEKKNIRPVIVISKDVRTTRGSGTLFNPYEI